MHMDFAKDLDERGTTPTHHFVRVMLLDFPHQSFAIGILLDFSISHVLHQS